MKIKYSQLKKIVVEEMKSLGILPLAEGDDLESVEKAKAKEIEPGDEADTLAKDTDFQKALKIKEAKLLKALGEVRSQLKTAPKRGK